eukprot:15452779-Alexandrium_andersonii.AAC.1
MSSLAVPVLRAKRLGIVTALGALASMASLTASLHSVGSRTLGGARCSLAGMASASCSAKVATTALAMAKGRPPAPLARKASQAARWRGT